MITGIIFSLFVRASFSVHSHHGQNRGYGWATAPRFGGVIPGIILFSFSSLRLSPFIPTTGKTVAMHGLPLCGSGERCQGSFFFLFVFASFTAHSHHGQNRGYAWATALRFGGYNSRDYPFITSSLSNYLTS